MRQRLADWGWPRPWPTCCKPLETECQRAACGRWTSISPAAPNRSTALSRWPAQRWRSPACRARAGTPASLAENPGPARSRLVGWSCLAAAARARVTGSRPCLLSLHRPDFAGISTGCWPERPESWCSTQTPCGTDPDLLPLALRPPIPRPGPPRHAESVHHDDHGPGAGVPARPCCPAGRPSPLPACLLCAGLNHARPGSWWPSFRGGAPITPVSSTRYCWRTAFGRPSAHRRAIACSVGAQLARGCG